MRLQDRRQRERKIVSHQIERRIADENSGKYLPAKATVFRIDAIRGQR
jgi:hypothetical protein